MNVKKDLIKKSGKPSPVFLKDNLLKTGTYLNVYDYKKLSKVSIPIFPNIERSPFCKRKKTERKAEGLFDSRILLMLALTKTVDPEQIQKYFNEY
ncbi:hypothetical protein C6W23_13100 [Bacillus atrophaeus]|nr:hypothetical protein C6W23_13100 [Bacillus atrophaeus]